MIQPVKYITQLMAIFLIFGCQAGAQKVNLTSNEFETGVKQSNVQVLDVRTAEEFETGHLANALQANWNNSTEFEKRALALDKSKPVYVYCLGGGRSSAAADWLIAKGYTTYNLVGGISKWRQAGKPVEQQHSTAQMSLEEYQNMIPQQKTVLVDFGAKWCPPCRKMEPILDSLQKANPAVEIIKIDGGAQTALVEQMKIDEFPTFIIYKQGKQSWRAAGLQTYADILNQLQ